MIVGTARDAADLLAPLFAEAAAEKLVVLHLDGERRLLATDERAAESEATVLLPLREIIAAALRLGAEGMVVAHNHPSGDPEPSPTDLEATRRLAATAADRHLPPRPSDLRRRALQQLPRAGAALGQSAQAGMSSGSGLGPRGSNEAK